MTDSAPSLARSTPPLTGASSMSTPDRPSLCAIVRVEDGLELDVSMRVLPVDSPSESPPSPKITSSTMSEFGKDRRITSASAASASGDAVVFARVSPKRARASGSTSYTKSSYPPPRR